VACQPRYIVAALSAMLAYGIMVLVMTATPVAMLGCGFTVEDSSWVIQWHALAMFVPSFFTGSADVALRRGAIAAIGTAAAGRVRRGVGAGGSSASKSFAIGLMLRGRGWNFGFLGGTTMLLETCAPEEKNKAQGLQRPPGLRHHCRHLADAPASCSPWFGWAGRRLRRCSRWWCMGLAMIVWLARHPYGKPVRAT